MVFFVHSLKKCKFSRFLWVRDDQFRASLTVIAELTSYSLGIHQATLPRLW